MTNSQGQSGFKHFASFSDVGCSVLLTPQNIHLTMSLSPLQLCL